MRFKVSIKCPKCNQETIEILEDWGYLSLNCTRCEYYEEGQPK